MPNATEVTPVESNSSKLYAELNGQAPAVIGRPVFAKHLEMAKFAGARDIVDCLGHKEKSDNSPVRGNLNFGSRKSCGLMPDESRMALFELKRLISAVEIQAQVMNKRYDVTADMMKETPLFKDRLDAMLKAFDVTDFSTWIARVNARFFFEEFEIPLLVGDLMDQLPMDSARVKVDGALGRMMGKLETDSATYTDQSNTSADYDVDAKNNVVHAKITEDLSQDSAPSVIAKLQREVVMGIARAEERSYLDGDTTGTHMDSDVTAGTDFRKAYKGFRRLAFDNNSASGGKSWYDHGGDAPSAAMFSKLLRNLGKFASEKGDLAWILGPTCANALVTGAIPELFTAFAYGGPASNKTGQVPMVYGVQPTESEWIREDLSATGFKTGSGTETFTWAALVKKSRFQRHLRAPVRVWAAPSLPSSDIMLMSAKKRHSFGGVPQSATEISLSVAFNVQTNY
jgi:hypothetical protein